MNVTEPPIVVTGAGGFLGSAIRKILPRATGLVRHPTTGCTLVDDYADYTPLPGSTLIHLAEPRVPSDIGDGEAEATIRCCRVLLAKDWGHVIYASSALVYGDQNPLPRRAEERVEAYSPYSIIKLSCEDLVKSIGGTVLRPANLYGPGMALENVLSTIIRQIGRPGDLHLRDLAPVRDFIHVDDAAKAFVLAADRQACGIYNVGSGSGISILELARLVLTVAGEDHRAIVADAPSIRRSFLTLDIAQTRRELRWEPAIALDQGIRILMEHIQ